MKRFLNLLVLLTLLGSCQHEPFPAPPDGMGNDTIQNPIDTTDPGKPCHPDTVYYSKDIQPILTKSCAITGCHDATTQQDGIRLTDYDNVMNPDDDIVRPFRPDNSDLYEAITDSDPDKRMPPPPRSALSAAEIVLIEKWINQGAQNLSCDDCDTTNLTYNNQIKDIFTACTGCHSGASPSAGLSLTNYQQVKDALIGPYDLILRINGGDAANPVMPQGGRMAQCNIDKIETWFNNGMPE